MIVGTGVVGAAVVGFAVIGAVGETVPVGFAVGPEVGRGVFDGV